MKTSALITANDPIPGHYKRRLVKGGPMVPARIYVIDGDRDQDGELDSDQTLACEVWDERGPVRQDPFDQWSYLAGNPITEAEFKSMTAVFRWAAGTSAPEGKPSEPVDLVAAAPIF